MVECNLKFEVCGFSCTGFEGGQVWNDLDKAVKKIDCESCQEHAKQLMSFIHDLVNAGLGKPLFDSKNFEKIYNQITCVYAKTTGEPT